MANPGQPDRKKVTVIREMTCDAVCIAKTEAFAQEMKTGKGHKVPPGTFQPLLENTEDVISLEQEDFLPKVFLPETALM